MEKVRRLRQVENSGDLFSEGVPSYKRIRVLWAGLKVQPSAMQGEAVKFWKIS